MKSLSHLKEWFVNHARHKDMFTKSIQEIKEVSSQETDIQYKDRTLRAFMAVHLTDAEKHIAQEDKKAHLTIVTINNPQNVDALIKNWKLFASYEKLNIFFINPFSSMDKRWVIYPSTHDRIADSSSLKLGLQSMAQMVEPISAEEFERRA